MADKTEITQVQIFFMVKTLENRDDPVKSLNTYRRIFIGNWGEGRNIHWKY